MAGPPDADRPVVVTVRSLLALVLALPAAAGTGICLGASALHAPMLPSAAAALAVALATGFLVVRAIASPIDEAVELAERFDAGDTAVRLDPERGIPQFRLLALILNRIADQTVDRDLKYEMVSIATGDAVWDWDRATDRLEWRGEIGAVLGTEDNSLSTSLDWWRDRIHPDDRERVDASFDGAVAGDALRWSEEYRFRVADGSYRWFWDRSVMVRDDQRKAVRAIGCMTDISRQRATEEKIWHLATHDDLTGCPNRTLFQRRLASLLGMPRGGERRTGAVLLVDIDDFKSVNDILGHDTGDELLRAFSGRLEAAMSGSGLVFRLGGDEFAVILPGLHDRETIEARASEVFRIAREPLVGQPENLPVRVTIGAVAYPRDGETVQDLMKNADIALHAGKAAGRDRLSIFVPEMRNATETRVRLLSEIRAGLDADQFIPHYQPVISLADGSVAGAEALMRWEHPDGLRLPREFAAAWEDLELALRVGRILVDKVMSDFGGWRAGGLDLPYVAINVSSAGFNLPQLAERLLDRFAAAGIPPSAMVVEVTEMVLLASEDDVVAGNLARLHEAGIRIALDDFGTGFASLTHLQQHPVDIIKIDRSFVARLETDDQSQAIVATMLELARRLRKTVIAEGVETLEQAQILRASGCEYAQGFLFARPMPAEALERFCRRGRALRDSAE